VDPDRMGWDGMRVVMGGTEGTEAIELEATERG
jgi:hypothetical protein